MLVVYSNIFSMCYDNWYATTRFICNLVRELLACSNVKIKIWIDRQTHFFQIIIMDHSPFSGAYSIKVSLAFS